MKKIDENSVLLLLLFFERKKENEKYQFNQEKQPNEINK